MAIKNLNEKYSFPADVREVDFVKTSTGFGTGGATAKDVALMKASISSDMKVKASGGVKGLKDAEAMIAAGAERIGASSGLQIMKELKGE